MKFTPLHYNYVVMAIILVFLNTIGVSCGRRLENREDLRYFSNCNSSSPSFMACIICQHAKLLNGNGKQQLKHLRGGDLARENKTVAEAFTTIYSKRIWGESGGGSGEGSKDPCGVTAKEILRQILFKYNVASILDAPCGGVHSSWMKQTILKMKSDLPCFRYFGVDVVDVVIHKNRGAFKQHEDWVQFDSVDLSAPTTQLPVGYDLILSRDALQHLSYKAIAGALRAYCTTASTYLLVGSYLASEKNSLIAVGETFAINVLLPPFSLPRPVEVFTENVCYTDSVPHTAQPVKSLLLYHLPTLCSNTALTTFIATYA